MNTFFYSLFQYASYYTYSFHSDELLVSAVVRGDVFATTVGIEFASSLLEEWLGVPDGLVDVVGAPRTIFSLISQGAEQAPDALVDIKLEQERGTSHV